MYDYLVHSNDFEWRGRKYARGTRLMDDDARAFEQSAEFALLHRQVTREHVDRRPVPAAPAAEPSLAAAEFFDDAHSGPADPSRDASALQSDDVAPAASED